MSYVNKGTVPATVIISREPDRSGNFICDGTADDVQIQLAIGYLNALGGGMLFIKKGNYDITAPMFVYTNMSIVGAGHDTVLQYDSPGDCFYFNAADNSKLKDLKIEIVAGAGAGGARPNCVFLDTCTNCEITGCWFVGDTSVSDDGSENRQCGIIASESTYVQIHNNRFETHPRSAIHLVSTDADGGHIVAENICTQNGHYGIRVDAVYENLIIGNTCNSCSTLTGIILGSTYRNRVEGNNCELNTAHGIYLATSFDNIVIGNRASSNTQQGIRISTSNNNLITNNTCNDNTDSGILHSGSGSDNVIQLNICNDNGDYGIELQANGLRNQVKNNQLRGNATAAFVDLSTDTEVHEIFMKVSEPDDVIGTHPCITLTDGISVTVYDQLPIPLEFQETVTAQVIIVPAAGGDMNRIVATNWGKLCSTEDYNANTDSIATGEVAVLINDMTCIDISGALTAIAGGDLIGISFTRDASLGADTVNADCYYLGFRLRYV